MLLVILALYSGQHTAPACPAKTSLTEQGGDGETVGINHVIYNGKPRPLVKNDE